MNSAVVTGCGQGLGRAIALRLARDAWAVAGLEIDSDRADAVRADLGAGHDVLVGDASDRGTLERVAGRARELAALGGWVNNAALIARGNLHDPDPGDVERLFRVNIHGAFWGCSTAVRSFIAQGSGGAIVNVSSIHAGRSFTGWAAYDTSKGAIESLTRYTAVEYGPRGIRTNAVAPGMMRTPDAQAVIDAAPDPDATLAELSQGPPLRRLGEEAELAAVVAFLLSDEASYVSGQCLGVDGGWAAAASNPGE